MKFVFCKNIYEFGMIRASLSKPHLVRCMVPPAKFSVFVCYNFARNGFALLLHTGTVWLWVVWPARPNFSSPFTVNEKLGLTLRLERRLGSDENGCRSSAKVTNFPCRALNSNDHAIERNKSSSPTLPTINDIRCEIGKTSDYCSCTVHVLRLR